GFRLEGLSIAHEKFNFLSNFRGLGDGEPPPLEIINPEDTPVVGDPGVSRCTMLDCLSFIQHRALALPMTSSEIKKQLSAAVTVSTTRECRTSHYYKPLVVHHFQKTSVRRHSR